MAIQIDITNSQFGIPFAGAYFRIVTAAVSRQRNPEMRHSVMIDVVGYAAKPTNEDTKDVDFRRYHVSAKEVYAQPGGDFLAQCYAWLATQPDMAGSVEV